MTVRKLINELLEMPMDANIVLATQKLDGNYEYSSPSIVVNYENGEVGILAPILCETEV